VTIFQSDCSTPLYNNEFVLLSDDVVSSGNGYKTIEVLMLVNNATALATSPIFNATSSSAHFCIRTGLHYDSSTAIENEVHFLETVVTLHIDLSAEVSTFEVTADLDRLEAELDQKDINYDAYVTAYLCDEEKTSVSELSLNQGDILSVCVRSIEGGVFVNAFTSLDLVQGGVIKFQAITGGAINILTENDCDGGICQAKIQLLALFFEEDQPDDLEVIGEVALGFTSSRTRRVEMKALISPPQLLRDTHENSKRKVQEEDKDTGKFDVSVSLAAKDHVSSPKESGALTMSHSISVFLLMVSVVATFIVA